MPRHLPRVNHWRVPRPVPLSRRSGHEEQATRKRHGAKSCAGRSCGCAKERRTPRVVLPPNFPDRVVLNLPLPASGSSGFADPDDVRRGLGSAVVYGSHSSSVTREAVFCFDEYCVANSEIPPHNCSTLIFWTKYLSLFSAQPVFGANRDKHELGKSSYTKLRTQRPKND